MECGYVEYKLCDKNYDCENCPFDEAIKKAKEIKIKNIETEKPSMSSLRFLTINHVWFYTENNLVTLGITPFTQKFFDKNCRICFPSMGSKINEDQNFVWIVSATGALGFQSPVSGDVVWINDYIKENASEFFNHDAFNIELIKVDTKISIDTKKFKNIESYSEVVKRDYQMLKDYLIKKHHNSNEIFTLTDGGEIIDSFRNHLSKKEYFNLLKLIFNKPKEL